jgi:hypothetical protein
MIARTRRTHSGRQMTVTILEYSSSSSRLDFWESSTRGNYFDAVLRSPRSPWPRDASFLASLRRSWVKDRPTSSCWSVKWPLSSLVAGFRLYQLSLRHLRFP